VSGMTSSRAATILGMVLFVSYAYFYQAGGWNQNSRFALVRAILEQRTLRIDDYQLHTGDKAIWNDHYYSDKPPGTALMVLAPVAIARAVARAAGVDPGSFPGIAWTSYVAAVFSAGLFTVLAALGVFYMTLQWRFSVPAALFAALGYGLAGPAWAFATLFMSHGVTAGCLMAAFYAAFTLDRRDEQARTTWALVLGLAAGWAVVTEFQAAIPAAAIGLTGLLRLDRTDRSGFVRVAAVAAGGAAACAVVLLAYNALAFGSPFHLGYSSEEGFEHLRTGFFGITYPRWWRVRELLIGEYRGIIPLAPLVAAAPVGLVWLAADKARRPAALLALGIAVYYFALNASYYYWEGGWSYAPRQVTPGLPFLALGLAPLWDRGREGLRAVLAVGFVWGAAATLVAVSTNPQPPSSFKAPMRELLLPAFADGDLSLNHQTFVHGGASPDLMRGNRVPHAAWNLGEIMGLHGRSSLVPLLLFWTAAAGLLFFPRARAPAATATMADGAGPRQFGNFAANLSFVDRTGVVSPGMRVLEIGTGTGAMLRALAERGARVEGVELREDLIDEARRWYGELPIRRVTGTALPFPEGSFDAVVSFDVFEHIPDTDAHLTEVRRVLRPGGAYLIQTPNKWANVLFETIRWRSFTRFREDHCSLHTLPQLTRRLARHGFLVTAYDVPVVNEFFRSKVKQYVGRIGVIALAVLNPDRLPLRFRTNLYVCARKTD
jgi:SAM-dependent methyltransferase